MNAARIALIRETLAELADAKTLLEILLVEAADGAIDAFNNHAAEEKIDRLERSIDRENDQIAARKAREKRRKELEQLRKKNAATPTKTDEGKATPAKPSYSDRVVRDERGRVIAYRLRHGGQDVFLTAGGKLIGREVDGRTFDATSRFRGYGRQGLRLVGTSQNRSKPPTRG